MLGIVWRVGQTYLFGHLSGLLQSERYAFVDQLNTKPPERFVLIWDRCKKIPILVILAGKSNGDWKIITLYHPDDNEVGRGRVLISPDHISEARRIDMVACN